MKTQLIQIFFIFLYTFLETEARRHEKVKPKRKNDPMSKLPEHITKENLCVGCYATTIELLKTLRGKQREYEIFDALKLICETNFEAYGIFNI